MTELSKPAYVVLGMIATGRRSGYAMSRAAKDATRHFWATSDGQIYPQLKKLSDDGYIEGERETQGGRERIVYSLTAKGSQALDEWLNSGSRTHFELRDEGLLRLFFAEELSVAQLRAQIEIMRRRQPPGDRAPGGAAPQGGRPGLRAPDAALRARPARVLDRLVRPAGRGAGRARPGRAGGRRAAGDRLRAGRLATARAQSTIRTATAASGLRSHSARSSPRITTSRRSPRWTCQPRSTPSR